MWNAKVSLISTLQNFELKLSVGKKRVNFSFSQFHNELMAYLFSLFFI